MVQQPFDLLPAEVDPLAEDLGRWQEFAVIVMNTVDYAVRSRLDRELVLALVSEFGNAALHIGALMLASRLPGCEIGGDLA